MYFKNKMYNGLSENTDMKKHKIGATFWQIEKATVFYPYKGMPTKFVKISEERAT